MQTQELINYRRVEKALSYIRQNFEQQPDLALVAEHVGMSPYHLQRTFTEWAGVSPKKFLQYLSIDYAKSLLREKQVTLFDAADAAGLTGTGRLHDLFVTIEGMTPAEYRNDGQGLRISYSFHDSVFGEALAASTERGLCWLAFIEDRDEGLRELKKEFSKAQFVEATAPLHEQALGALAGNASAAQIRLHLRATEFQLKVWQSLLRIPEGNLSSYSSIAAELGNPKASRAVGSAVGQNPVAYIIPCHRVVQATGNYGEYRWGSLRKSMLIGWEAARQCTEEHR